MLKRFLFLAIHHLTIFEALIRRGLIEVFQKLQLVIYTKPFLIIITIFTTSCRNFEMLNKKEKNYKKINTSRAKWAFKIEIGFNKFGRVLYWWNVKINKRKLCKKFYQISEISSGTITSVGSFINSKFHLLA